MTKTIPSESAESTLASVLDSEITVDAVCEDAAEPYNSYYDSRSDANKKLLSKVAKYDESRKWAKFGKNGFYATPPSVDKIAAGMWSCHEHHTVGAYIDKMEIKTDELFNMSGSFSDAIVDEIELFWRSRDRFKKFKNVFKRGILLYGPPGTGKTSTIHKIAKNIIDRDGIVINVCSDPDLVIACVKMVREIEPERPMMVIMEDFDTLVLQENAEARWLTLLDGELQIDNVIFLATTNYIEKIDKRFVDRPSRFDIIQPVPAPTAQERAMFLMLKGQFDHVNEIKDWVSKTKTYSIAHLKELITSVRILGHDLEDTIKRLNKMRDGAHKTDTNASMKVGFGSPGQETDEVDWDKLAEEFDTLKGQAK